MSTPNYPKLSIQKCVISKVENRSFADKSGKMNDFQTIIINTEGGQINLGMGDYRVDPEKVPLFVPVSVEVALDIRIVNFRHALYAALPPVIKPVA